MTLQDDTQLVMWNCVGAHTILITQSHNHSSYMLSKIPRSMLQKFIYNSHVWIHDNKLVKCHFATPLLQLDEVLSNDRLSELFGLNLTQMTRNELIKQILE